MVVPGPVSGHPFREGSLASRLFPVVDAEFLLQNCVGQNCQSGADMLIWSDSNGFFFAFSVLFLSIFLFLLKNLFSSSEV